MTELLDRLKSGLPRRYTAERELARGGMGIVFLARELHPEREVAIKVLDPQLTAHLGRERFLREIDVASKLTHPHILPIFAAGEADELLYYVMPFIEGPTLAARLRREAHLPIDDALRIAWEVSDALEFAHQRGIVHRDIKPGNILLHEGNALVADFGVARAIAEAEQDESMTESGAAIGTPQYMSPEQVSSDREIDGRADIYALGCVLFEMIGGEPPYAGRTSRVILARQMVDPIPSVRALRTTTPPSVETVIRKSMAKVPTDRFRAAREMSDALRQAHHEHRVRSDPSLDGLRWGGRRRPWTSAVTAIAATAVVALIAAMLARSGRALPLVEYDASLAVLPVENLTGDATLDGVADDLFEEIRLHLQKYRRLKVTSGYSVHNIHGRGLSLPQIADTLGVGLLMEGNLRLRGGQLALSMEVVDSTDASRLTRRYEVDPDSRQTFVEQVAEAVVSDFLQEFGDLGGRASAGDPGSGPARKAHEEGRRHLLERTHDGIVSAIAAFERALELDSTFAPAYADLASAYTLSLRYRYRIELDGYHAAGRALAMASRAIQVAPDQASGYSARGLLGALTGAPLDQVEADFTRAREIDPNAPDGPSWSARILAQSGRTEAAVAEAERAVSLDPFSAGRRVAVASLAMALGRFDRAVEEADVTMGLQPGLMLARAIRARSLLMAGRPGACAAMDLGPYAVLRATCLHAVGDSASAAAIVDSVMLAVRSSTTGDTVFTDVVRAEDLATYYAWLGNAPLARQWVQRAYGLSPTGVESRVLDSPLFDRVREDAGFAQVVSSLRQGLWNRVVEASRSR